VKQKTPKTTWPGLDPRETSVFAQSFKKSNRRQTMKVLAWLLLCVGLCVVDDCIAAEAGSRPNIILIVSDNQGVADLGFRGSAIQTPNIDRLADGGVVLDAHYVFLTCSPSRAGLLMGRNPSRYGILQFIMRDSRQSLPPGSVTIAEALRSEGYATAISGKWHLGLHEDLGPRTYGFDESYGLLHGNLDPITHLYREKWRTWHRNDRLIDEPGHPTDLITREALRVIDQWKERPYFLYVPYNTPHGPFVEDERWTRRYEDVFDDPLRRLYSASITHMDDGIGQILQALEDSGQRDRTLVVFFSDNGAFPKQGSSSPYRGAFGEPYEGGVRMPAVISWPERLKPAVVSSVTSILDWYPTLLEIVGATVDPQAQLEGRSIWSLINGTGEPSTRTLYWRSPRYLALRQGAWKLIIDMQRGGDPELYNLESDPHERKSIADRNPDVVDRLLQEIQRQADRDPLPAPQLSDSPRT
jgi:arylsulfatase A-like enzyme